MRTRIARVLITTDKHVVDKDFKTVQGYRNALRNNMMDQIVYCENNDVTHVFDTGDIGDRGFKVMSQAYSWENMFKRWRETVQYYTVIGNHLFLEMDTNPELYWIQPSEFVKPRDKDYSPPDEPLIKTVRALTIGSVMFSFHHFNRENKDYWVPRPSGITHHHAIYHDDVILPSNIQKDFHSYKPVESHYLNHIYSNVDSATVGHIHKPYGCVRLMIGDKEVPIDVPGSCGLTNRGKDEFHKEVHLPQYDIYDDGTIEKSYITFSCYVELIKFYEPKDREVPKEIQEFSNDTKTSSFTPAERTKEILTRAVSNKMTVEQYLTDLGYSSIGMEIFERSTAQPLNAVDVLNIIYSKENKSISEFDLL